MVRGRFPSFVYRHGTEPDPRFSLANERTFLAWIRTSLALVAAGVALEALPLPVREDFRVVSAVLFISLGLLAAVQSWIGWARAERALRGHEALPGPTLSSVMTVGVLLATVLVALGLFDRRARSGRGRGRNARRGPLSVCVPRCGRSIPASP